MDKELTLFVTCYNHAKYIPQMLESIFDQTLNPTRWKFLMLFDACTDDSEKVFNEYWNVLCHKDIYNRNKDWLELRVIRKDVKKGLANAKNYGLSFIDTPYIAFQDSDDFSMPSRLEYQLNYMQQNQEVDICGTQSWDIDERGRMLINCFSAGQYENDWVIKERLPVENVLCHGSVVIKKSVLEKLGGYDERPVAIGREDYFLWLKARQNNKIFYNLPERLYCYRLNSSVER